MVKEACWGHGPLVSSLQHLPGPIWKDPTGDHSRTFTVERSLRKTQPPTWPQPETTAHREVSRRHGRFHSPRRVLAARPPVPAVTWPLLSAPWLSSPLRETGRPPSHGSPWRALPPPGTQLWERRTPSSAATRPPARPAAALSPGRAPEPLVSGRALRTPGPLR